ncbi:benzoylformate decarboxylase [Pseudooceanicola antarcticus]|uniref:Benzoylformate decarboxylase n=1 Tax=Pseudooceanicola antarcticus TaxID=1247613 RepID=A0A285JG62_9RHOB|nr:benzoylformate decarboxylase [Pseudooceanicola antarcticus]PJE26378.1 benzoylformate decarboxylase [Pseudooceanicola antarcticus]SNY59268.1 benzoylformate decarboxylase [Pseudooceanicola antarcticus]
MTRSGSGHAMTVRDAVFELLQHHGMTTIFGNPGSTELPLFSDLPEGFRYVTGLQESVVVAMADGHALASGGPAFVNLHSAAGVGHAMGSIYSAYRNRAPVVITAGQQSRPLLKADPFLYSEASTELPKPYVKWAIEPARAEDVPAAIARAIHMACLPPAGPVFVSIPLDDWALPCEPPVLREVSGRATPDAANLAQVSAQLEAAADPVLVVGAGVDADGAWEDTVALAEHYQAPVWVAPLSSRCSFPESHPLFAGFLPANEADISRLLGGHDLIAVLGAPVFTYHYEMPATVPPEGAALVQIVSDPHQAAGAVCGTSIVGDLGLSLASLRAAAGTPRPKRRARMRRKARLPKSAGITPALALATLQKLRPEGGIVVEEAPSSRGDVHDHLPIDRASGFFATASGGLGYALPAAVGVALSEPGQSVLAVLGDGSSMYSVQGLWSAVEHGADVIFVVLNNGGYAALKGFAGNKEVVGCDIGHLSLAALAEAQGCPAERVSEPAKLEDTLSRAFAAGGPRLVEVMIDTG